LAVACIETPVAGIIVVPSVTGDTACSVILHEDNHWVSVHEKTDVDAPLATNEDGIVV
jgi:hypothetical protein